MKPVCIVKAPVATRSGYGEMSRDIIRHLIELDMFDLKVLSVPWGATPQNALVESDPIDKKIIEKIVNPPLQLAQQPDVFISIVIPNEFENPAKVNIGITAGIETTLCSESWIDGCNRVTTVWGISNHAVMALQQTIVQKRDQQGKVLEEKKSTVPFEVLHNFVDTDVFKKISSMEVEKSVDDMMLKVKEDFCFLFVGHWVRGGLGEDRKNVGLLVKTFCETFKDTPASTRPALLLKTSGADFSILDREEVLMKIKTIRDSIGVGSPNVYLIHGDLTKKEMNSLYNHPKVKTHISFTKGEGFGRPLLEACMSEKPIIASGWSGQLDFLNPHEAILLSGEIRKIEPGAVWENILIPESSWFNVDVTFSTKAMKLVFKEYNKFLPGAKQLAKSNAEKFGPDAIKKKLEELLKKYMPEEQKMVKLTMPTLGGSPNVMKLPTLKKVEAVTAQ